MRRGCKDGGGSGAGKNSTKKRGRRSRPLAARYRSLFLLLALLGSDSADGFLRGLGHAELHHLLGGDLDRFAGGGIAAHARLAVHQDQLAEAGKGEAVLGMLVG